MGNSIDCTRDRIIFCEGMRVILLAIAIAAASACHSPTTTPTDPTPPAGPCGGAGMPHPNADASGPAPPRRSVRQRDTRRGDLTRRLDLDGKPRRLGGRG